MIGPASTLEEAIALVASNDICGAILDVHLPDGDVGPLLPALIARQVAIVVQTGGGLPQHLQDAYPDLLVLRKPNAANMLVQTLERSLAA